MLYSIKRKYNKIVISPGPGNPNQTGNCLKIVKDVDVIFHIAGNIGGIGYNQKYPGSIFYDNLIMGIQLLIS
mgnify:CR=1 FL=1